MFFDLDRLNFMAPFTNNVCPTKCNSEKNHQLFESLRVGHMGGFQIETPGFQTNEKRFDGPTLLIIFQSGFRLFLRSDNDEFTVGHLQANDIKSVPPYRSLTR